MWISISDAASCYSFSLQQSPSLSIDTDPCDLSNPKFIRTTLSKILSRIEQQLTLLWSQMLFSLCDSLYIGHGNSFIVIYHNSNMRRLLSHLWMLVFLKGEMFEMKFQIIALLFANVQLSYISVNLIDFAYLLYQQLNWGTGNEILITSFSLLHSSE